MFALNVAALASSTTGSGGVCFQGLNLRAAELVLELKKVCITALYAFGMLSRWFLTESVFSSAIDYFAVLASIDEYILIYVYMYVSMPNTVYTWTVWAVR